MTAPLLLILIENSGGHLEVSPDGHLRAQTVPLEYHAAVREHADALIVLLQERAKPPATGFLAPPPAPGFVYHERSPQQWHRRIHQSLHVADEPKEPQAPVEKKPKAKAVTGNTLCDCGHPRDCHRQPRLAHPPLEPSTDMPCEVNVGCACPQFSVSGKPFRPRIAISEWTLCQSCGHARRWHCTKRKPGLVNRLEPGESAYRILQKADGTSYGCRHFDPENPNCQCDSTGCSASLDDKNFCECLAFQNPWLVRKTRVATKKRAPRKAAVASLASAATESTLENVLDDLTKRPRKKRAKKTAFMTGTGTLFPPAVEVSTPATR